MYPSPLLLDILPLPTVPGGVPYIPLVPLLCSLLHEYLCLVRDLLHHLSYLHHGLHLLLGVQGEQVKQLLDTGLGILKIIIQRYPDVLKKVMLR